MVFAGNNVPYDRKKGRDYLLWLDLETTGTDVEDNYILEIGAFVSDRDLNEIESKQIVLPITETMEANLPEVVRYMHTVNGLLEESKQSLGEKRAKYSSVVSVPDHAVHTLALAEADSEMAAFVRKYNGSHHMPLAGSGVSHFDRKYIDKYLPKLSKRITHFSMDIGGVRRWMELAGIQLTSDRYGATMDKPHRALDDARIHRDEARRWILWARDRLNDQTSTSNETETADSN